MATSGYKDPLPNLNVLIRSEKGLDPWDRDRVGRVGRGGGESQGVMTGAAGRRAVIFVWRECGIEGVLTLSAPPPSLSPVPATAMASLRDANFLYKSSPIPPDCTQRL